MFRVQNLAGRLGYKGLQGRVEGYRGLRGRTGAKLHHGQNWRVFEPTPQPDTSKLETYPTPPPKP